MDPIAFTILGKEIRWYGIMAAVGFMAAVFIMQRIRNHANLKKDQVSDITMIGMIGGVIGARIFYVIQFWDQFSNNYLEIIRIDHGGLVFYGGFIVALGSIVCYCIAKKISLIAVLDVSAPSIAMGHAMGRIGCFMNGCCYGKSCDLPWGVIYPLDSEPGHKFANRAVHPVQLYEVFGNILICVALLFAIKKVRKGQTAAIYLVLYGILRFVDELFRGDHTDTFMWTLTRAQFIGLILIPIGLIWFLILRKSDNLTEIQPEEVENA